MHFEMYLWIFIDVVCMEHKKYKNQIGRKIRYDSDDGWSKPCKTMFDGFRLLLENVVESNIKLQFLLIQHNDNQLELVTISSSRQCTVI